VVAREAEPGGSMPPQPDGSLRPNRSPTDTLQRKGRSVRFASSVLLRKFVEQIVEWNKEERI
jgi:hypothetical protein